MHSARAGVAQYDTKAPPRYASRTDLGSRVGGLNPRWNEAATDADLDERFRRAMALTGAEFLESVDYISQVRGTRLIPSAKILVVPGLRRCSREQVSTSSDRVRLPFAERPDRRSAPGQWRCPTAVVSLGAALQPRQAALQNPPHASCELWMMSHNHFASQTEAWPSSTSCLYTSPSVMRDPSPVPRPCRSAGCRRGRWWRRLSRPGTTWTPAGR